MDESRRPPVVRTSQRWPDAEDVQRIAGQLRLHPHRGYLVLVLNFRGAADTIECVGSLLDGGAPASAVLVIDNASGGADAEQVAAAHPSVAVLALPENLGYAGGNDVATLVARASGATGVIVLNNDTTVAPRFVDDLVDYMTEHPEVTVACPEITWYHDPGLLWYGGGSYSPWRGYAVTEGRRAAAGGRYSRERDVTFATGCAMAIRLGGLRRAMPFVPEFFGYVEDAELSLHAVAHGGRVVFTPRTWVRHKEGIAFAALGGQPLRIRLSVRNTLWVARRYLKWYHWAVAGPRLLGGYLGRFALIFLIRRDAASLRALLEGLGTGLRSPLPASLLD